jgi:Icc-related predicted phosphoesterase
MTILVLADLDDLRWRRGAGHADLVVSLGDVADAVILDAAAAYRCPRIFAVKGNHDAPSPFPAGITDLHLTPITVGGWRFGGFHGAWRYKPHGHFLYAQDEATTLLAGFPPVDVFVAHNAPRQLHDHANDGIHVGFDAFNDYIERCRPTWLLHGHQHVNAVTRVGETFVVGTRGYRLLSLD